MHPRRVQQPELEVGQLGQSRGGDAEERAAVAEHRLAQYGQLAVQLVAALHTAAVTLEGEERAERAVRRCKIQLGPLFSPWFRCSPAPPLLLRLSQPLPLPPPLPRQCVWRTL